MDFDQEIDHAAEGARYQQREAAWTRFHEEKERLYQLRHYSVSEAEIREAAKAALTPEERSIIEEQP